MNERQFKIYNEILKDAFGSKITMTEQAGKDWIKIKINEREYVVYPDGDVLKTGPRTLCDGCIHTFEPIRTRRLK